ncbi:MAG: hypothetical protein QXD41_02640 [Nitrososphaeria archaeon]
MNAKQINKKLTILVLYFLRDIAEVRDVLIKFLYFLKKYQPNHYYIYHDVGLKFPDYMKHLHYDAVILDVSLLALRFPYNRKYFTAFKDEFNFLKDSNSVKIGFPQDEYDCCKILDDWLCSWNVQVIFSPLADNPDLPAIYPNYSRKGVIEQGYTGYVDDSHFEFSKRALPFEERPIDVGYRARKLPPYFGRIGEIKWRIGEHFKEAISKYGHLKLDISCDYKDVLLGEDWYNFLGKCRFVLGSLSGSSLLDPEGEIQQKVRAFCKKKPNYSYEEVERNFFPSQDRYFFTAISPRNIEAAFMKTGQILVKGPYSGILEPWKHYIPIDENVSNIDEVLEAMSDHLLTKAMINNCYERVSKDPALHYRTLANKVISYIYDFMEHPSDNNISIQYFIERYNNDIKPKYKLYQLRLRTFNRIKKLLGISPFIYDLVERIYKKIFY